MDVLRRGLNVPLPAEFPRDQLIDICATLVLLPSGTAEGCRAPLEYARKRLPSIRREHIATDGARGDGDTPLIVRGAHLDQKLATLISSVSTALDAYGRLAADETGADFKPEAGIRASKSTVEDVVARARDLDAGLGEAQKTVGEVSQPGSTQADDLQRQLQDARGLSQLTSAEVRMPRVVPGWLRTTVGALKNYPDLIRRTASGLQLGADVAEVWIDRWHEFKHEGIKFLIDQFRKATKAGERTADILERQQRGGVATPPKSSDPEPEIDEDRGVARAIRRREQIQTEVRRSVGELEKVEEYIRLHIQINDPGATGTNPTVAHAERLRGEHQVKLVSGLSELARIDRYLTMHRQFAVAAGDGISPTSAVTEPTLGVAGSGYSQRIFQLLTLMVLRDVGRPMQSGEVVDAFAERGHALGGVNPTKTAWNRLWEAKTKGVLDHLPDYGYWIKGQPLPAGALESALAAKGDRRKLKRKRTGPVGRSTGRAHGRKRILTDADVETARSWLVAGKAISEVCADLGGISSQTLWNYIPGGARAFREKHPHLVQTLRTRLKKYSPQKERSKSSKRVGRPPTLGAQEIASAQAMHSSGMSVNRIAESMQVSPSIIYKALYGIRKPRSAKAKEEGRQKGG
jgi:hypothetical protein